MYVMGMYLLTFSDSMFEYGKKKIDKSCNLNIIIPEYKIKIIIINIDILIEATSYQFLLILVYLGQAKSK